MSNEKDMAQALNIAEAFFQNRLPIIDGKPFASVHSNPTLNLADKIAAAVTTARKEAREEAWRDAIKIAKDEAFERRMAFNVYDALVKAAATQKENDHD